jgi:hypothetical protein
LGFGIADEVDAMAVLIRDGIEIIKQRFGIDPKTDPNVQSFAEAFHIGLMVYDAPQRVGMTQKELAGAIGTTESIVAALEEADYEGDSITLLRRIAASLQ